MKSFVLLLLPTQRGHAVRARRAVDGRRSHVSTSPAHQPNSVQPSPTTHQHPTPPPFLNHPTHHTLLALRSRNGNISSGRFKVGGMDAEGAGPSCPRCGLPIDAPFPDDEPRRGRRRIWCSTACRRAAHAERAAAERTGTAIRVIEVPRYSPAVVRPVIVPRPPTIEDLEIHVLRPRFAGPASLQVVIPASALDEC